MMAQTIFLLLLLNFGFDGTCKIPKTEKFPVVNQIDKEIGLFPIDYKYSGWRGGIGVAFGQPTLNIPDITELGVEIVWGGEDAKRTSMLDIAVFDYWNSVVEISIKDPEGRYDFSHIEDKEKAAVMAFDKYAELQYGASGLSKYAKVKYIPDGAYGDVYGEMDLSSINPLVKAVVSSKLERLTKSGNKYGGMALDNAGKVPEIFLEYLQNSLHPAGFGIFTNGGPSHLYRYVDLFANEGFQFSQQRMHNMQVDGFKGVQAELLTRQLSSGELEKYLKAKHFNGIVYFGYTDGRGRAAGTHYSFFSSRPDIYDHQRWVLRKILPLTRSMFSAGSQDNAYAYPLNNKTKRRAWSSDESRQNRVDATGRVIEPGLIEPEDNDIFNGTLALDGSVKRYGDDIEKGIYFYVSSNRPETVECLLDSLDAETSGLLVFDEFSEKPLKYQRDRRKIRFETPSGPSLIQFGKKEVIVEKILSRISDLFEAQLLQREMDEKLGIGYTQKAVTLPSPNLSRADFDKPMKPWTPFCQGYLIDLKTKRSGRGSLRTDGNTYSMYNNQWPYHNRQGAAQFVTLNQSKPVPLTLTAYSKSVNVKKSDLKQITDENRRDHFGERLGYYYAMHLYLDYQDGNWPEVYTFAFSPGTHDWEEGTITVVPKKAVKTAMVLVELHQPEGTAWFDDFNLVESTNPQHNLLASADFENSDILLDKANAHEYDLKVSALNKSINKTRKKVSRRELKRLENEIKSIQQWLISQGIAEISGREMRDFYDAAEKLRICRKLLER